MTDASVFYTVTGLTGAGMLTFCLGILRFANGRLSKKVERETCHTAQKAIHDKIDTLETHMHERFEDLKDVVQKNGKEK